MPEPSETLQETHPYHVILWENKKEILFLITLVCLSIYFLKIWIGEKEVVKAPQQAIRILTMENVEIEDYDKERKRWKIYGSHARAVEESKNILIREVEILIYTPDSPVQDPVVDIRVTARQGLIEGNNQKVILKGEVITHRGDNLQLNTEKAIYDYKNQVLYLPEKVVVHRDEHTLWGEDLTYTLGTKQLVLKKVTLMQ